MKKRSKCQPMKKAGSKQTKESKTLLSYKTLYNFQKLGLHNKFVVQYLHNLLHPATYLFFWKTSITCFILQLEHSKCYKIHFQIKNAKNFFPITFSKTAHISGHLKQKSDFINK